METYTQRELEKHYTRKGSRFFFPRVNLSLRGLVDRMYKLAGTDVQYAPINKAVVGKAIPTARDTELLGKAAGMTKGEICHLHFARIKDRYKREGVPFNPVISPELIESEFDSCTDILRTQIHGNPDDVILMASKAADRIRRTINEPPKSTLSEELERVLARVLLQKGVCIIQTSHKDDVLAAIKDTAGELRNICTSISEDLMWMYHSLMLGAGYVSGNYQQAVGWGERALSGSMDENDRAWVLRFLIISKAIITKALTGDTKGVRRLEEQLRVIAEKGGEDLEHQHARCLALEGIAGAETRLGSKQALDKVEETRKEFLAMRSRGERMPMRVAASLKIEVLALQQLEPTATSLIEKRLREGIDFVSTFPYLRHRREFEIMLKDVQEGVLLKPALPA